MLCIRHKGDEVWHLTRNNKSERYRKLEAKDDGQGELEVSFQFNFNCNEFLSYHLVAAPCKLRVYLVVACMRGLIALALAEYAIVLKMLGNSCLVAYCFDGIARLCHIRGKMRMQVWISEVLRLCLVPST